MKFVKREKNRLCNCPRKEKENSKKYERPWTREKNEHANNSGGRVSILLVRKEKKTFHRKAKLEKSLKSARTKFDPQKLTTIGSLPKPNLFQIERILDDAGGGHTNAEDVLLRRQIVHGRDTIDLH